jgi:hypothetical protein
MKVTRLNSPLPVVDLAGSNSQSTPSGSGAVKCFAFAPSPTTELPSKACQVGPPKCIATRSPSCLPTRRIACGTALEVALTGQVYF